MIRRLLSNERGATVVEIALALPIIILMFYGIFVCGLLYEANASLHHSLGQGARKATLWDTPSDTVITETIVQSRFPMAYGTYGTPTVTTPAANQRLLTVSYSVTPDLIFFRMPPVAITRTKLVRTVKA